MYNALMYALLLTNTDDRMLVIDVAYCIIGNLWAYPIKDLTVFLIVRRRLGYLAQEY